MKWPSLHVLVQINFIKKVYKLTMQVELQSVKLDILHLKVIKFRKF